MTPFFQSLIFRCIGYNLYHVLEIWIYCESSVKLKMNCEDKILCSPCQFLIIYYVISFITKLIFGKSEWKKSTIIEVT